MSVKPITSHSQFISIIMEEGKTVIVDFVSERCPHCKAIAPTFDELANKFSSDKIEFYVIDAEKVDDVSFEVGGITSYPTFIAFKDGNKMEESTFGAARERLQYDTAAVGGSQALDCTLSESLLKVPLILSSAIALHVSFTTGNLPSSKEVVRQTFNEWIFTLLVKYGFPTIKAFYWVVSFAEIATIAYHTTDPNSVSAIQDTPITFLFVFGTALAITGGLIRCVREGQHVITTGPYAVIRHPAYTAGLAEIIGLLILHGSANSWLRYSGVLDIPGLKVIVVAWLAEIALLTISVVFRVSQEDEILKSGFRDEWEAWAKARTDHAIIVRREPSTTLPYQRERQYSFVYEGLSMGAQLYSYMAG
ncbi:uncharacterized protein F5891DRAFT_1276922 [Suillus fuscotomentosus]|uniref:Thioredoxin domain-containing protein n=1 Tax=Suillus fuscotomentosus TaxID=1912939 RepID=A0AAD4HMY3_9AGAM|nr:uncharacterized protein F5891DRAFT_1276922 [Suillus fuscotomentosus]KAG1902593.1 hypothetical protein F5891DRAFT_1276922 [Suillus fuscotomentosus]